MVKGKNSDVSVLSNHKDDGEDENLGASSVKHDTANKVSRSMKGKTFKHGADGDGASNRVPSHRVDLFQIPVGPIIKSRAKKL